MSAPGDVIIVDTGPLLALDACRQIEVLRSLYTRVVVPDVVEKELSAGRGRVLLPAGLTAAHRVWIEVLQPASPPKAALLAQLDPGEAAVISLALELSATVVLIDGEPPTRSRRVRD